ALLQKLRLNMRPQFPSRRIHRLIFLFNPDSESRCAHVARALLPAKSNQDPESFPTSTLVQYINDQKTARRNRRFSYPRFAQSAPSQSSLSVKLAKACPREIAACLSKR